MIDDRIIGYICQLERISDGAKYISKCFSAPEIYLRTIIQSALTGKKGAIYQAIREDGFDKFKFSILYHGLELPVAFDELENQYIEKASVSAEFNIKRHGKKNTSELPRGKSNGKLAVTATNIKSGEILTFDSLLQAAEYVNGQTGKISRCARGITKSAYGYAWRLNHG